MKNEIPVLQITEGMPGLLEDDIVRLRALEPEDLELLYTIENDTATWCVSNTAGPYSRFALRQYLAAQPRDIFEHRELRLVIVRRADDKAIGLLDITSYEPVHARAEVGLALLVEERGQGYASRSLSLIHEFARTILRLHLLYAHVSAKHNPACHHLFTSKGYTETAILPGWNRKGTIYEDVSLFIKNL